MDLQKSVHTNVNLKAKYHETKIFTNSSFGAWYIGTYHALDYACFLFFIF